MRNIHSVSDDGSYNTLILSRKTSSFLVLYHSTWDPYSKRIVEKLLPEWVKQDGDEVIYLVSSWDLPHAFGTFNITSAPSLVRFHKNEIEVMVEYPSIYSYFTK